jgi:ribosomal protein S18 acetylase RimI-like enzyme
VAELPDGAIAGVLAWIIIGEPDARIADGLVIAVSTSARRLGIGRALLEKFLMDATSARCDVAIAQVHRSNAPMLALWKSLGAFSEPDDDVRFVRQVMPL